MLRSSTILMIITIIIQILVKQFDSITLTVCNHLSSERIFFEMLINHHPEFIRQIPEKTWTELHIRFRLRQGLYAAWVHFLYFLSHLYTLHGICTYNFNFTGIILTSTLCLACTLCLTSVHLAVTYTL